MSRWPIRRIALRTTRTTIELRDLLRQGKPLRTNTSLIIRAIANAGICHCGPRGRLIRLRRCSLAICNNLRHVELLWRILDQHFDRVGGKLELAQVCLSLARGHALNGLAELYEGLVVSERKLDLEQHLNERVAGRLYSIAAAGPEFIERRFYLCCSCLHAQVGIDTLGPRQGHLAVVVGPTSASARPGSRGASLGHGILSRRSAISPHRSSDHECLPRDQPRTSSAVMLWMMATGHHARAGIMSITLSAIGRPSTSAMMRAATASIIVLFSTA